MESWTCLEAWTPEKDERHLQRIGTIIQGWTLASSYHQVKLLNMINVCFLIMSSVNEVNESTRSTRLLISRTLGSPQPPQLHEVGIHVLDT